MHKVLCKNNLNEGFVLVLFVLAVFLMNTSILVEATTSDSDNDGVPDIDDLCTGTPVCAVVDSNGCPVCLITPSIITGYGPLSISNVDIEPSDASYKAVKIVDIKATADNMIDVYITLAAGAAYCSYANIKIYKNQNLVNVDSLKQLNLCYKSNNFLECTSEGIQAHPYSFNIQVPAEQDTYKIELHHTSFGLQSTATFTAESAACSGLADSEPCLPGPDNERVQKGQSITLPKLLTAKYALAFDCDRIFEVYYSPYGSPKLIVNGADYPITAIPNSIYPGNQEIRMTAQSSDSITFFFGTVWGSRPPCDRDGDGVPESSDLCLGTPQGTTVDTTGCPCMPSRTCALFEAPCGSLNDGCGNIIECGSRCTDGDAWDLIPPNIPLVPPEGLTYGTMGTYCGGTLQWIGSPTGMWGGNKFWSTVNGKTFYVRTAGGSTEDLNELKDMISNEVGADNCATMTSPPTQPNVCTPTESPWETTCSDNIDNDCDGDVDCSDSDCSSSTACQITPPTPPFGTVTSLSLSSGYNIISSPLTEGVPISTIEQECDFVTDNDGNWIFELASEGRWMPVSSENILPLKGYLVKTIGACTVSVTGTPVSFSELEIGTGYALISSEGNFDEIIGTCENKLAADQSGNSIFGMTSTGEWFPTNSVNIGTGYVLRANEPCTLKESGGIFAGLLDALGI